MSPSSYDLVGTHCVLSLDGAQYWFKSYNVAASPDVDLIADAKGVLGDHVVHVVVDITSASIVKVSVNGNPADPANGKTVSPTDVLDIKLPIHSMTCHYVSGTTPAIVEVMYFTGAVQT